MTVSVEFYGIPRQRAGTAQAELTVPGDVVRLGDLLIQLAERFPNLAESCLNEGSLCQGYVANLGGRRFVTDPETRVHAGETLLIMSADAGG
jgi:molybdopterin converting factor small subunit